MRTAREIRGESETSAVVSIKPDKLNVPISSVQGCVRADFAVVSPDSASHGCHCEESTGPGAKSRLSANNRAVTRAVPRIVSGTRRQGDDYDWSPEL